MSNTEEELKRTQKERNTINYIRQNTRLDDPKVALSLYNKIIDENLLRTSAGVEFLKELQEKLNADETVDKSLIKSIPAELLAKGDAASIDKRKELQMERERQRQERIAAKRRQKEDRRSYRRKFQMSLGINFVLLAIILGMFFITYISGNNVNIVNYENELINKYEKWEQELNEREAALNEREAQLNNK